MTITDRLDLFQADLLIHEDETMVRRHILHGSTFALDEGKYYDLKQEVSNRFEVQHIDIFMVGSGKLGFSIAPNKKYKFFDNESDIDIAIVSTYLFDKIWKELYIYEQQAGTWEKDKINSFKKYFFKGWIRPDLLPTEFSLSRQWSVIFDTITGSGKFGIHKINAGIYHSMFFLENYHKKAINALREI